MISLSKKYCSALIGDQVYNTVYWKVWVQVYRQVDKQIWDPVNNIKDRSWLEITTQIRIRSNAQIRDES